MSEFLGKRTYQRIRHDDEKSTNVGQNARAKSIDPSHSNSLDSRLAAFPSGSYQLNPQLGFGQQRPNPGFSPHPQPTFGNPQDSQFQNSYQQAGSPAQYGLTPYNSHYGHMQQYNRSPLAQPPPPLQQPAYAAVNLHLQLPSGQFSTPNSAPLSAVMSGIPSGRTSGKGSVSRGERIHADRPSKTHEGHRGYGHHPADWQDQRLHPQRSGSHHPHPADGSKTPGSRRSAGAWSDQDDNRSVNSEISYCPSLVFSEYQGFPPLAQSPFQAGPFGLGERHRFEDELAGIAPPRICDFQDYDQYQEEPEAPQISEEELAKRARGLLIREKLDNRDRVQIKSILLEEANPQQTDTNNQAENVQISESGEHSANLRTLSDLKPLFNFEPQEIEKIPSLLKGNFHWELRRLRNFLRNPEQPDAPPPKGFDPKASKHRSSTKLTQKKSKSGSMKDKPEPELSLSEKYIQDTVEYTARSYISIVNGLSVYQDREGDRRHKFKDEAVNPTDRNVHQSGSSSRPSFRAVAKLINTLLKQLVLKDGDFVQLHNFHKSSLKLNHSSSFSFFDIVTIKTLFLEYYKFLLFKQQLIQILTLKIKTAVVDSVREWSGLRAALPAILTDLMEKHGFVPMKVVKEIQSIKIVHQGLMRVLEPSRKKIDDTVPSKAHAEIDGVASNHLEKEQEILAAEKMPDLEQMLERIKHLYQNLHQQVLISHPTTKKSAGQEFPSERNANFILPIATKSSTSSARLTQNPALPQKAPPTIPPAMRDQLEVLKILMQDLALSRYLQTALSRSCVIKTNPTVTGNIHLNIYHHLYPAKKVQVSSSNIKSDLILKILEAESKGYLKLSLGFKTSTSNFLEEAIRPALKTLLSKYLLKTPGTWMDRQRSPGFDLQWVFDNYTTLFEGYLHEGCIKKMEDQALGVVAYSYIVSIYEEVSVPHLGYYLQSRQQPNKLATSNSLQKTYQPMVDLPKNLVFALYLTKTLRIDVLRGSTIVYSVTIPKQSSLHPQLVDLLVTAVPDLVVIHINSPAARDLVNMVTELIKDFCEISGIEKHMQPKIIPVNARQNERQAYQRARIQTGEFTTKTLLLKGSQSDTDKLQSGVGYSEMSEVLPRLNEDSQRGIPASSELDIGQCLNLMNTEFAMFPALRLIKERFALETNQSFMPVTKSPYRKHFSRLNQQTLLVGFDLAILQFMATVGIQYKDFTSFPEVFGYFLGFKQNDLQEVTQWMIELEKQAQNNINKGLNPEHLSSVTDLDGKHGKLVRVTEEVSLMQDELEKPKVGGADAPSLDPTGTLGHKETISKLDALETRSVKSGYSGRSKSTNKSRKGYIPAVIPEARLMKILCYKNPNIESVDKTAKLAGPVLPTRLGSLKSTHLLHYTMLANPLSSKLSLNPESQILPFALRSKLKSVYEVIVECKCDTWEGIQKIHTDLGRIIENIEESLIIAGQTEVIRKLLALRNIEVRIEERKVHASGDAEYQTGGNIPDNLSATGSVNKETGMPIYSRVGSAQGSAAGSYFNTSVIHSPNRSGAASPNRVQERFREGIIRGSPYLFYSKPNSSGGRTPLRSESPNRPVRAPFSDKFTSRSGSDRDDRSSCEDVDSVIGMPTGGFYTRQIPIFYNSTTKQVASFNRLKQELSWILTYVDVLMNPAIVQTSFWDQRLKSARHKFEETYFSQLELIRRDRIMPVKVTSFDEQNIYVTILGIVPGLISLTSTANPYAVLSRLKVGENIPAKVIKISPKRGVVLLSIKEEDFSDLTHYLKSNKVLEEYGLKQGQSFTLHYLDLKNLDHHKIAAKTNADKKRGNLRDLYASCRDFHRWTQEETDKKFRDIARLVVAYTPHEKSDRHLYLTYRVYKDRVRKTIVKVHEPDLEGNLRYEVSKGNFFQNLDEVTFKYVKPIVNMIQLLMTDFKGRKRWFEASERESVILELTAKALSAQGREIPYRVTLTDCNRFGAIYYCKNGQVHMEVFRILPGLYYFHKKNFTNLDHLAAYIRNNQGTYVLEKSVAASPRVSPERSQSLDRGTHSNEDCTPVSREPPRRTVMPISAIAEEV